MKNVSSEKQYIIIYEYFDFDPGSKFLLEQKTFSDRYPKANWVCKNFRIKYVWVNWLIPEKNH